jgi:glycosyltransferase involved in cell wall biosynthesis
MLPVSSASLIIRTYNEERYHDQVLTAAKASTDILKEIIVIDSGSSDATVNIASSHGVKLLFIKKQDFSFGRSLNLGCASASSEVVVFVSGHCIPFDENWLHNLLIPFVDPRVAAVYGRQVGTKHTNFSEGRVFAKYYPIDSPSQSQAFCNNANAAVRRSIWRRFKYDEDLPGLEDLDLGLKIVAAGFRIEYAPASVVSHMHHETWPQVKRRYEREAIALRSINPAIHLSLREALFCFLSATLFDCWHAWIVGLLFSKYNEIFHYRLNQFWGSWLGCRSHRMLSTQEKKVYFFPS